MAFALELCDFSFSYPKSAALWNSLNWRVEQGAFVLLVGATGSGKTTLLRCCKPELAPAGRREGSVRLLGENTEQLKGRASAETVGYVSQNPENQIVCDTVWHEMAFGLENLGLPQDVMRRRVAETAHFLGIEPWFRLSVNELSGGQKQLLNLASVLALRPRVLLLDEPTTQLDPVAEKNFLHALFRINRELGLTVVVATHAPEAMAAYATEAVELADGTLQSAPLQALITAEKNNDAACFNAPNPRLATQSIAVRFTDVFFRYTREGNFVLRGCDLRVRKGSAHAVVGGNGCGKTTLLRVAAGLSRPERGRWENVLNQSQVLLPQNPTALFACDTVREELCEWQATCGFSEAEVNEWLERIGLAARAEQHPLDLSGGQQQLLAFAKLMLTNPQLLLLDEPTKGLDTRSKLLLARELCAEQSRGVTVLMATHDLSFAAAVADEVTLLFDGEVACTEPPAQFFENNVFYRPTPNAFSAAWRAESERAC